MVSVAAQAEERATMSGDRDSRKDAALKGGATKADGKKSRSTSFRMTNFFSNGFFAPSKKSLSNRRHSF
jgi:hypothetical protein